MIGFRYPPDLVQIGAFTIEGYQQEATASFGRPDRRAVFEIHMFFTPADEIGLVRASPVAPGEYRFVSNQPATVGGDLANVIYGTEPSGNFPHEVQINYIVSPRPNWYLQVFGYFAPPYDQGSFADFNALVSSITFTP